MLIYTSRSSLHLSRNSLDIFAPDGSEPPGVVAYLRSRPSEGAASDEAMFIQRELLAKMTHDGEIVVVAEFVEQEADDDDRPAYRAAYREAVARGCALLTAGWGAIGAGPWFRPSEHNTKAEKSVGVEIETIDVSVPYVRFGDLVPVPDRIPAAVGLWADGRRPQGVTAVYLCNAGPGPMEAIELVDASFELGLQESFHEDRRTIEPIPAGMARLLTVLFHDEWTFYSRYRLSYVSGSTAHGPLVASDADFDREWFANEPRTVWVGFRPAKSRPPASDASPP